MTKTKIALKATKREVVGKKVKKLRQEGLVPANIYGSHVKSQAITIGAHDFKDIFKQAGETQIIDMFVEGEKEIRPVLISHYQVDPVHRAMLHVDFRQVNLKEKIKALVEILHLGKSEAESVGGVLVTVKDHIEVEALPTDLPEHFEVDLSALKEIGDTITVAALDYNKDKVEIFLDAEEVLVKVEAPKTAEQEAAEEEAEAAEAEQVEEDEAAEGEEEKEGEDSVKQNKQEEKKE